MKKPDFNSVAVEVYAKIVEESLMAYLDSEEAVSASELDYAKQNELREKMRAAAKNVAIEIVERLTKEGAFNNKIDRSREKKIISEVIMEHVKKWKSNQK